ncbi:hypothetical protein ABH931_000320 [Streptacidiphilus sp. MAP12-33]|uniref:hypothetical protein n=1 Tax=Streptacidiphilus sp. MAP12-33 TaxID=3156266 RepID=UPI003511F6A2
MMRRMITALLGAVLAGALMTSAAGAIHGSIQADEGIGGNSTPGTTATAAPATP